MKHVLDPVPMTASSDNTAARLPPNGGRVRVGDEPGGERGPQGSATLEGGLESAADDLILPEPVPRRLPSSESLRGARSDPLRLLT